MIWFDPTTGNAIIANQTSPGEIQITPIEMDNNV